MKTSFLLLSLFLSAILLCEARETKSSPNSQNPVLDTRGKPIKAGVKYYVVPLLQDQGGGFDLASTGTKSCPKSVVQDDPYWWGNTIQFYPVDPQKGVIRELTDVNIEFPDVSTGCHESNVWKVIGYLSDDEVTHYITVGGRKGNPGQSTVRSWFKIAKTPNAYKLTFCPDVCDDCEYICQDVGITIEGGQRRLVLTNTPLEITFRKA